MLICHWKRYLNCHPIPSYQEDKDYQRVVICRDVISDSLLCVPWQSLWGVCTSSRHCQVVPWLHSCMIPSANIHSLNPWSDQDINALPSAWHNIHGSKALAPCCLTLSMMFECDSVSVFFITSSVLLLYICIGIHVQVKLYPGNIEVSCAKKSMVSGEAMRVCSCLSWVNDRWMAVSWDRMVHFTVGLFKVSTVVTVTVAVTYQKGWAWHVCLHYSNQLSLKITRVSGLKI